MTTTSRTYVGDTGSPEMMRGAFVGAMRDAARDPEITRVHRAHQA